MPEISPVSSVHKATHSHVEHVEPRHNGHPNYDEESRMEFRPPQDQTVPKFIQIEQGAKLPKLKRNRNPWSPVKNALREPFAEFLGCMVLIIFGDGVVAQVVLSKGTKGDFASINWGWGIGVMFGVYIAGGISGGHLNPAVTLTNCILRKFPWRKFPIYMFAQTLGCFVGSAIIYANYKSAFDQFEGHGIRTVGLETSTAVVFCTYPAPFMTRTGMVFSEFIASAVLMMVIFAIGDQNNLPAGDKGPLVLFFLIFGIGATLGWETGYAINFARDFGPRLFSYMIGYGSGVWTAGQYYFWIPMVMPFFGCLFGGFLYDLFIFQGPSPINSKNFGLGGWRHEDFSRDDEKV